MGRSILLTFISRFGAAMLNFATIVLLSRYLGPDGKGITSRFVVIVSGVQIICDFMGGAAMVYLSSRFQLRSLLIPAWTWAICWSVISTFIIKLIQPGMFALYGWHIAWLSFICATLFQHIHLLNGREMFRRANLLTIIQAAIIFIVLWWNLQNNATPDAYYFALYAGFGIPWLLSLYFLAKLPHRALIPAVRQGSLNLLRFGTANQAGHLIQFFTQRIAFFLLPAFSLGIYSNAISLSESLWMIASSVASVQYGKISNSPDRQGSALLTSRLLRITLVLTAISGTILCLLPDTVFTYLFGTGFTEVGSDLPLIFPGILLMSGYLIIGHYFSGLGLFRMNNIALLSGLLFTIAGFSYLNMRFPGNIPHEYAAIVTSFANMAIFFSVLWLFLRHSKQSLRSLLFRWHDYKDLLSQIRNRMPI